MKFANTSTLPPKEVFQLTNIANSAYAATTGLEPSPASVNAWDRKELMDYGPADIAIGESGRVSVNDRFWRDTELIKTVVRPNDHVTQKTLTELHEGVISLVLAKITSVKVVYQDGKVIFMNAVRGIAETYQPPKTAMPDGWDA